MDAINLSTSRLVQNGKLVPDEGWRIIIIAVLSNTLFKGLMVRFWGGGIFFKTILLPWLGSLIAGAILLLVW